ncbi:MAG: toxin HipA [Bacteroidetes bacterium GWA2_31_9]|nr:MAG: toxin HipA [Bacteroidetes bacterium GWA2_31_9]
MGTSTTDIWVYAHWAGMSEPSNIGILSAHHAKGRKSFSFEYNKDWLKSKNLFLLDPEIGFYSGKQFSEKDDNFGIFLDSMPDSWGRTLLKKKESLLAKKENRKPKTLHDIDFLLGIADYSRMGALRFKLNPNDSFLGNSSEISVPPWVVVRDLQNIAQIIESESDNADLLNWLNILIAPGSSLGGARPKANIKDQKGSLLIAKFPSKNDIIDKAKWEYLAYLLARKSGINISESLIEKVNGNYHTFFTKRFDRINSDRIHFASAMTMTGNNETTIRDNPASYLDLALFIQERGGSIKEDLSELWRRIVFNIAISNTDDHLRNHGFILNNQQWRLSPAYDINPSTDKEGLSLNIDEHSNALDYDLAISVGEFFRLNKAEMDKILINVREVVSNWEKTAKEIKISKTEIELMQTAFRF